MRSFVLGDYNFICESKSTREGFKHVCNVLNKNGFLLSDKEVKICYLNRTWERFQYESVVRKAIEKLIPKDKRKELLELLDKKY